MLKYYCSPDKSVLDSKLYSGYESRKRLVATLGEAYDADAEKSMRRLEKFYVDHSVKPLLKVKDTGIPKCLMLWRMADSYQANVDWFDFYLCTGKTECIFL